MADICYTDAAHADVGVLRGASLNVTWGDSGNDFELTVDLASGVRLEDGALVYVEGTEWGGVVDEREASQADGTLRYRGRSWHGVLRDRVLCPDPGADYLVVSGEANAVLLSLVSRMGLSDVMTAPTSDSGVTVKHTFDRFCDAYSGIRAMLAASGARLAVAYDATAGRAVLSAVPVRDWSDGPTSDVADVDVTRVHRPYNHLVCLGRGELRDRVVQHWYADDRGNVSGTQTLTGVDERATTYDYTNATADELAKDGPKKLAQYQLADSMSATLALDGSYAVGDVVPGTDVDTGTEVSVTVGTVDVTVTDGGVTATYKAGGTASSGSSSGSSESSGGGVSYAAGDGIQIVGRTISAEVTQDKLDAVSKAAAKASQDAQGVANDLAAEATRAKDAEKANADAIATEATRAKAAESANAKAVTDEAARAKKAEADNASAIKSEAARAAKAEGANSDAVKAEADARANADTALGSRVDAEAKARADADAALSATAKGLRTDVDAAAKALAGYQPRGDYAAKSHQHAATDVTSGVLPVARGGTGNGSGNAPTASRLATARTITLKGAVTGSAKFDGSKDVTITCEGQGAAASFLAAHPVGSVFESTSAVSPAGAYGGTWERVPSLGAFRWERTA